MPYHNVATSAVVSRRFFSEIQVKWLNKMDLGQLTVTWSGDKGDLGRASGREWPVLSKTVGHLRRLRKPKQDTSLRIT